MSSLTTLCIMAAAPLSSLPDRWNVSVTACLSQLVTTALTENHNVRKRRERERERERES